MEEARCAERPPHREERRALLIFADALARDLARRGWSRPFRPLLESGTAVAVGASAGAAFDVHRFTPAASAARSGAKVHPQEGDTFAERLENAVGRLAGMGYAQIVVVGRDCPGLDTADIRRAFAALDGPDCRLVLGPDHRGGSYLIGLRAEDCQALLIGVRWQRNTDFAEMLGRAGADRTCVLPVKQDLDTWADLRLLAHSVAVAERWRLLAARLLAASRIFTAVALGALPRVDSFQRLRRLRWQLPPPPGRRSPLPA